MKKEVKEQLDKSYTTKESIKQVKNIITYYESNVKSPVKLFEGVWAVYVVDDGKALYIRINHLHKNYGIFITPMGIIEYTRDGYLIKAHSIGKKGVSFTDYIWEGIVSFTEGMDSRNVKTLNIIIKELLEKGG